MRLLTKFTKKDDILPNVSVVRKTRGRTRKEETRDPSGSLVIRFASGDKTRDSYGFQMDGEFRIELIEP